MVCLHLQHAPHTVFRLMMASKGVRSAFVGQDGGGASNARWWADFFKRVCAYQNTLKHSNFRKRLLAYERRGQLSHVDIIRAVFSPRCERCGTRFGHRLLRPFGLRSRRRRRCGRRFQFEDRSLGLAGIHDRAGGSGWRLDDRTGHDTGPSHNFRLKGHAWSPGPPEGFVPAV
jgi:hypothetical protein